MDATAYSTTLTARAPLGDVTGLCAHYYRAVPGGIELRSRYWFGYDIAEDDPAARPVRVPDQNPTEEQLRNMTLHNMIEYPHLARILPQLYAEESWKPLRAY